MKNNKYMEKIASISANHDFADTLEKVKSTIMMRHNP
jgi:hypothetical protein